MMNNVSDKVLKVMEQIKALSLVEVCEMIQAFKAEGIDVDAGANVASAPTAGAAEAQEESKGFKVTVSTDDKAAALGFIKLYRKLANEGKLAGKGKASDTGAEMTLPVAKQDMEAAQEGPFQIEVVDAKDLKEIKEAFAAVCKVQ